MKEVHHSPHRQFNRNDVYDRIALLGEHEPVHKQVSANYRRSKRPLTKKAGDDSRHYAERIIGYVPLVIHHQLLTSLAAVSSPAV